MSCSRGIGTYYSKQVRKAKFDIDDAQVRPYFELNHVLREWRVLCREPALRADL